MEEKTLKPRIRFKGFTEAWEQRELGNEGATFTGLSGKTKDDFGHGEGSFVTYMNVFKNPIADPQTVEPIDIDNSQREIKYGDIFFTTSSETPEEVGMSSIWPEKSINTYLNSFCFGYRLNDLNKYDLNFLAYNFRADSFRKDMILLAQGISRYNISKNKVMEIQTAIPKSKDEQIKIGKFLVGVDSLITLHQRKFEKLTQIKKSLLEKMFPADGANKPKIRFKGFTEAWEQRKLNEMVDYISSNLTASDASKDGNYELYDANNIIGRTNHEPIKTGYLTIIKDGAGVGRIRKMPKNTMFIGTMGALKPINNSLDFVFSLLIRFSLSNEFSGSTIPHIYFKDYGNNIYSVPKLKEQNKIGDLYCNLDNLITLHQRKCEKLKNIKKSLLEKMFV